MSKTGFNSDSFEGKKIWGLRLGKVLERGDKQLIGRVRAEIPGLMDRTAWARPKGGGSPNNGGISIPPVGADIYIEFINGEPDQPVWSRADWGIVDGESEVFEEHTDPDVHVFGIGMFRIVVDDREIEGGQKSCRAKLVKVVGGEEQDIVWIEITEGNSLQIHADNAIGLEAGAVIDINAPVVQIKDRKVMANSRPIN
jgi:hypothetical protein